MAIGVALPVAVLAILFAAFLSWRHRKNIRETQGAELPSYGSSVEDRQYPASSYSIDADSKGFYAGRNYSDHSLQELETMNRPPKTHSPPGIYEMGPST